MATLKSSQEAEYRRQKFAAALKGIDLDKESNKQTQKTWAEILAEKEAELGIETPAVAAGEFDEFGLGYVEGE